MPEHTSHEERIVTQLDRTTQLLDKLENSRYLQMIDRPGKFLFMSFLQGLAVALGSTLGLTIIITIVAFILRKLEVFTPVTDQIRQLQDAIQSLHK